MTGGGKKARVEIDPNNMKVDKESDGDEEAEDNYLPGSSLADAAQKGKMNGSATASPVVEDVDFDELDPEGFDDNESEIDFGSIKNNLDQDVKDAKKSYSDYPEV